MGDIILLQNLRRKRAYVQGEIEAKQTQLACLRDDRKTIDRMICLIDGGTDPTTIKGIRPHRFMEAFNHGDQTRLCYEVLREAGEPMSARQMAEAIAQRKGVPLVPELVMRVRATLGRLTRAGKLQRQGIRRSLKWDMAG